MAEDPLKTLNKLPKTEDVYYVESVNKNSAKGTETYSLLKLPAAVASEIYKLDSEAQRLKKSEANSRRLKDNINARNDLLYKTKAYSVYLEAEAGALHPSEILTKKQLDAVKRPEGEKAKLAKLNY